MLMQKLYTRTSSKGHNLGHVCLLVVATIRGIRNPVSSLPSIGGAIRGREGGYVGKARKLHDVPRCENVFNAHVELIKFRRYYSVAILGLFRSCPFVPLDQRDQSDTLRAVCAECLTMRLREKDKERDLTGPILSHKLEALICVKSILS
ncbi:hypothetical protein HZH68_011571 [Vespula germanica]|uniref:Uncharacterized protein n=1 Tax=Vespula germanica TaxID=30212 RepID=A0A834N2P4_VESGE|nr:hypothetical protein HZH68_011571 [Vespula germanica]